jgi:NAD(P)-dependent dehydrogenase (short-subunit alcohol dehydrogenase family)
MCAGDIEGARRERETQSLCITSMPMTIVDSLRPPANLRVLVAAGAGGFGAAIARAFHDAGSRVHVCDVDRAAIDRLTRDVPGITGSMADASVPDDVDLVFDDVRGTLGGLDVLVNNAGIAGPTGAIESIDAAGWTRTVDVNLNSQYYFARRAVPLLKESRANPVLIAMGCGAGRLGHPYRTPYASTQWAIVGMTKSLAIELGPHGVRVNAILPGMFEREADTGKPAARRMVTVDDVAAMALFLSSPAARNITGQAISVDGDPES